MPDVVDLIMQDHREVERMFERLKDDPASRPGLVTVLSTLLTAHSRAEEAEVYPAARDEAGETEEVAHSQTEHVEADRIMARLLETDPTSQEFEQVLGELVAAVTHHVEEEETKVLPGMRDRLEQARREELGEAFLATRANHLGDHPEDIRKSDLQQQAANAGISGASSLTTEQLREALQQKAQEEEAEEQEGGQG